MALEWEQIDGNRRVFLDSTMLFGNCYDWEPFRMFAEQATGKTGGFLLWPNGAMRGEYSLYRNTDGGFRNFASEDEAKQAAEQWDTESIGNE